MKKLFSTITFCLFTFILIAQQSAPEATTATGGVLTVSYAIANPGTQTHYAVYITNSDGQLVNTLGYRYSTEGGYQDQLTTMFSLTGNTVNATTTKFVGATDGTTGATFSTAQASKTVYWGKTGTMATSVAALADGNYTVNFELVKRNNNRSFTKATFAKGKTASTPTVSPAISTFTGISIQWTPAATTGINDIQLSNLYSIYPNPSIANVYVNGPDIQSVEVFTLEGKFIFSSNQQKLNISALQKGTYLLNINTGKGSITKKLVKN